jgi:Neuraminidase-like domain
MKNRGFTLDLDAPQPLPTVPQPVLDGSSATSQVVQLKAGVPYHLTAQFAAGATGSVLIQGESMGLGPLGQATLYPQGAVSAFETARTLLSKTLQIASAFNLNQRELDYLASSPSIQHATLSFNKLPTSAAATAAGSTSLFTQFLALADYADLRKTVAGNSDGLTPVFATAGQTFKEPTGALDPTPPWYLLATLTRRPNPAVVRETLAALGLISAPAADGSRTVSAELGLPSGMRRFWEALKLVQVVGIPVSSLVEACTIVSTAPTNPDQIAGRLRNAVRSKFDQTSWRPVAKSIFDKLRRQKRDALVAYLVQELSLEDSDELFEYFLVDPGMEPVVQTSRIRLALSSVQTFIQRCLLNLESGYTGTRAQQNVSPAAIDANAWEWMKRYRVWGANRRVFLFPENWMVPEWRLDASDLFQALEGAVLQGDVTQSLAEDAFNAYLQSLEERARLNIVSMYFEQKVDASQSILHVLGRTYAAAPKYFYRTYSNEFWEPWIPVTPDISGDHVAIAVWRGRVNVFWVAFNVQAQVSPTNALSGISGTLAGVQISTLASNLPPPNMTVQMQLNRTEYFQGKWSKRVATGMLSDPPGDIVVGPSFHPGTDVSVRVVSEPPDANGVQAALQICLDFTEVIPYAQ